MKKKYMSPTIRVNEIMEDGNLLQGSGILNVMSDGTEQQVINPNDDDNTVDGGAALGKLGILDMWE